MSRFVATLALALTTVACAELDRPEDPSAEPEMHGDWDGIVRCLRTDIDVQIVVENADFVWASIEVEGVRLELDGRVDRDASIVELTEVGGDAWAELTFETLHANLDPAEQHITLELHDPSGPRCSASL